MLCHLQMVARSNNLLILRVTSGRIPLTERPYEIRKLQKARNLYFLNLWFPLRSQAPKKQPLYEVDAEASWLCARIYFLEILLSRNLILRIIFSQSEILKMDQSLVHSLSPEDFQELSQSILLESKEPSSPLVMNEGSIRC